MYLEGPSEQSYVNDSEERPENSTREQSPGGLKSEGMTTGCQTSEAFTCRKRKCSQKKERKNSEYFSDFLNVPKWASGNINFRL